MDCSLSGSSVHGISQTRILEWIAISFSRESFWPSDRTHVCCISRWICYHWDTREALFPHPYRFGWASPVAQMVKSPPAMKETWVWPLGQEDPLEKGTATHSSILAWRIPWTEQPGRLQSMGSPRVRHNRVTNTHTSEQVRKGEGSVSGDHNLHTAAPNLEFSALSPLSHRVFLLHLPCSDRPVF